MSEQNSSPFMQTDKISDNKYDSLIDMGEEIYRATVGEALPVSSKETYERILKIHESGEYDMAFCLRGRLRVGKKQRRRNCGQDPHEREQ